MMDTQAAAPASVEQQRRPIVSEPGRYTPAPPGVT